MLTQLLGLRRLIGLESGASALIEIKALLSEELVPLAPCGRGLRVEIYLHGLVEEYSLNEQEEMLDVDCVGGKTCCHRDRRRRFHGREIGMGGPGRAIKSI